MKQQDFYSQLELILEDQKKIFQVQFYKREVPHTDKPEVFDIENGDIKEFITKYKSTLPDNNLYVSKIHAEVQKKIIRLMLKAEPQDVNKILSTFITNSFLDYGSLKSKDVLGLVRKSINSNYAKKIVLGIMLLSNDFNSLNSFSLTIFKGIKFNPTEYPRLISFLEKIKFDYSSSREIQDFFKESVVAKDWHLFSKFCPSFKRNAESKLVTGKSLRSYSMAIDLSPLKMHYPQCSLEIEMRKIYSFLTEILKNKKEKLDLEAVYCYTSHNINDNFIINLIYKNEALPEEKIDRLISSLIYKYAQYIDDPTLRDMHDKLFEAVYLDVFLEDAPAIPKKRKI